MRQVYATSEIPHLWAHGKSAGPTGDPYSYGIRNSPRSLYCSGDGRTIYSYGSHFPIARRVETKQGIVFLVTTAAYSATTDRHTAAVRQAIRNLGIVFYIHPGRAETTWNAIEKRQGTRSLWVAEWYNEQIQIALKAACKPRIRGTTRLRHIDAAKRLRAEWVALHEFFKLPCGVNRVPEITEDIDALKAEHAEAIERERKSQKQREASAKRAQARRHAEALQLLPSWRATGEGSYGRTEGGVYRAGICDLSYPALRVSGAEVKSSHGARVPVDSAKALLRMVPRMDYGKLIPVEVGPYTGVRVNSTALHIGCHSIPWVEVFAFCDYYEWDKPTIPEPVEAATA